MRLQDGHIRYAPHLAGGLLVLIILLFSPFVLPAQRIIDSRSDPGMLFPMRERPWMELHWVKQDATNQVFAGATTQIALHVINRGTIAAEDCWLRIDHDSPHISFGRTSPALFSILPGDTITIRVPVQIAPQAPIGPMSMLFSIREMNGFNMLPERLLHFFVEERPAFELVVVDVAVQDQTGVGYIEKFEQVDLTFRLQNCGERTLRNATASLELSDGTIPVTMNPQLVIGDMPPNKTRDFFARVTTTLAAQSVGARVRLLADDYTHEQDFQFAFRTDYKKPEELLSDGCDLFLPETSTVLFLPEISGAFTPQAVGDNHFAIIIENRSYIAHRPLEHARRDAEAFRNMLIEVYGFPQGNILHFQDLSALQMHQLFTLEGNEGGQLQNAFDRVRRNKEVYLFYVGYGAADVFHGELFLMPRNFVPNQPEMLLGLEDAYGHMRAWQRGHMINSITCFFQITYPMVSQTGRLHESETALFQLHRDMRNINSFFSNSAWNSQLQEEPSGLSAFTKLLIKGLSGAADLNQDQSISTDELYRFLSDEAFGVPARMQRDHGIIQTPLHAGYHRLLFQTIR